MGDSWKEVEARVRGRSSWWKTGVHTGKHVFGEGAGECPVFRRASSGEGFYVNTFINRKSALKEVCSGGQLHQIHPCARL